MMGPPPMMGAPRPHPASHTYPSRGGEPKPPLPPPNPGQENFSRREDNWPPRYYHVHVGESIYSAVCMPGAVRHDVLIERRVIGRLLGKGGRDLAALKESSGAQVFIIDGDPPPGEGDEHRLLSLVGHPECVGAALERVEAVLDRARKELPPLARHQPVPSVGPAEAGHGREVGPPVGPLDSVAGAEPDTEEGGQKRRRQY